MSSRPAPSRTAYVVAFAAIYLIWGSTYLGIRIAIETMPPFALSAARFLIAGALLLAILRAQGVPWPGARQWLHQSVIGTFLLLGGNGSVAWAEQYIPSGVTALIIGISPLFIVLLEWLWPGGQRPSAFTLLGLALGFVGVAWLATPQEPTEALHLGGVLAILAGCASWAIGAVSSRHVPSTTTPLMVACLQMLGGGLSLAIAGWLHGDFHRLDLAVVSGRSWIAFTYLVLVGSLIGFSTFVWLMKHASPARVATYAYVNPVVAVFLGWLLADEIVTLRTLSAAGVIVLAVMIIVTAKSRGRPPPEAAADAPSPVRR